MSEKKEKKVLEAPSLEMLEAELKKEQYKSNYSRVLKSTTFSLVVVAAVAVLVAVLVLPVLQISGTSMTDTLQDGDIVVAVNRKTFETGDVIAFYYNNSILVKRVIAFAEAVSRNTDFFVAFGSAKIPMLCFVIFGANG